MVINILISGFGGQGLMRLGKIIAKSAILENKYTSWFPSYGAQMRGGTAHCFVKISDRPIASPFIEYPDAAIIMNQPSLDKFKPQLKKASAVILNSDLINSRFPANGVGVINLALNKIALELGNIKVANIVALGVLLRLRENLLKKSTVIEVLKKEFSDPVILNVNLKGFRRAEELLKK